MKKLATATALAATLLVAAPPAAQAAPTNDAWLVRVAMNAAWNQQSARGQRSICVVWYVSPRTVINEFVPTILEDNNVSHSWATRFVRKFFNGKC